MNRRQGWAALLKKGALFPPINMKNLRYICLAPVHIGLQPEPSPVQSSPSFVCIGYCSDVEKLTLTARVPIRDILRG